MPDYPRHPATVEFGELECCALREANARGEHQDFISSFITMAQEDEPRYNVSILSEIFTNTTRLVFIPRSIHRVFYLSLAIKERDIFSIILDTALDCGHEIKEHIMALDKISSQMAFPQGSN